MTLNVGDVRRVAYAAKSTEDPAANRGLYLLLAPIESPWKKDGEHLQGAWWSFLVLHEDSSDSNERPGMVKELSQQWLLEFTRELENL